MPVPPAVKRLVAFVDGQALYRAAKDAFGYSYPNYDVQKLVETIARQKKWYLSRIYFYTGIPDSKENTFWHSFWTAKLAVMGTRGIKIFTRAVRYQNEDVRLNDGTTQTIRVGHEKGIDVRIALDIVRLALEGVYDVGLIFSQDQDLSEAVDEVRLISKRWVKLASAFPSSVRYLNQRGINKTDWIPIDKAMYDSCIDPIDYKPKHPFNPALP